MDLIDRAGDLKGMLVDFGSSPRFRRELSAVIEGIFEVTGKDGGAVLLVNMLDELTYRTWSNMGGGAFRPLKKGMVAVGRLVPIGDDWLVSGHLACMPASSRGQMLALAARQALSHPEAVFRNPAKLAEAHRIVAEHHATFVALFGSDLIVVPGGEVAAKVEAFHRQLAPQAGSGAEPPELPAPDIDASLLADEGVAIYHAEDEGLSLLPGYHLLDELFGNPALISRSRHRDILSGYLRDPDTPPEPLRRLAARDPAKASAVLGKLLKSKRSFSWDTGGEELLRRYKPSYFDGTRLPATVPLSKPLAEAYKKAH